MGNGTNRTEKGSIYDVFNDFLKKTVIEKKSFFPDNANEKVFDSKVLSQLVEHYVKNFIGDGNKAEKDLQNTSGKEQLSFEDKAGSQLSKVENEAKIVFGNLMWLQWLPARKPKNGDSYGKNKCDKIEEISGLKVNYKIDGIAEYGLNKMRLDDDLTDLILMFSKLAVKQWNGEENRKLESIKEYIVKWCMDEIVGEEKNGIREAAYLETKSRECPKDLLPIHNMLLHLCKPTDYSSTVNINTKRRIARNLYKLYFNKECSDVNLKFGRVDVILKQIYRDKLESKYSEYKNERWSDVFWMEKDIKSQWQGGYVANAYEILTKYQKQVILYGAPGTGKTYSAEQIIKEFIYDDESNGNPNDLKEYQYKDNYDCTNEDSCEKVKLDDKLNDKKVIWEIVQFNQSYSYEDFIEGLRPTKDNELKIVHGIFKRFAKVAAQEQNKKKKFIFIVDEINRGKIDKIFGELLYLLEYRDKEIRLHYSNDEFSIPKNVYIVGTMNTADKSIALLDVALRRRFWFVRCEPNRDVLFEEFGIDKNVELKISNDDQPDNIKKLAIKLFDWLNKQLDTLGSDADELKIGHSYFLKLAKDDVTFSDLKNIWFYSIVPLIEEYCGFDKTRVENLLMKGSKTLSKKENFTLDNLNGQWN